MSTIGNRYRLHKIMLGVSYWVTLRCDWLKFRGEHWRSERLWNEKCTSSEFHPKAQRVWSCSPLFDNTFGGYDRPRKAMLRARGISEKNRVIVVHRAAKDFRDRVGKG
ncbi:MAG: hypothetical protein ACXABY_09315 [Candidatus Thorarchaeota archaeon]